MNALDWLNLLAYPYVLFPLGAGVVYLFVRYWQILEEEKEEMRANEKKKKQLKEKKVKKWKK